MQSAPGTYTLKLGDGVHDLNGDALALFNAASSLTAAPPIFTSTGPTPIPNKGTFVSAITVNQSLTIASLTVTLNISYPTDGNLLLHLQAPDGTDILLVNERGGSGANFQNTILKDNASASIRFATAPFAGSFQPETPLSTFAGRNALGVWKLWIVDFGTGKSGVVNSWSLAFTPRTASPATASVSGENTKSAANAVFAMLAGEPSGSSIVSSPAPYHSAQVQAATADAVFLSKDLKGDLRTLLLPGGWPLFAEHSTDLSAPGTMTSGGLQRSRLCLVNGFRLTAL